MLSQRKKVAPAKKSRGKKKVAPAKKSRVSVKKVAPEEKKIRAKGKKVFARMKKRIHLQCEAVRTRVWH